MNPDFYKVYKNLEPYKRNMSGGFVGIRFLRFRFYEFTHKGNS